MTNKIPEAPITSWVTYYIKEAKTESRYVSNHDLAVAIASALEPEDAEEVAQGVLDIINFSRE